MKSVAQNITMHSVADPAAREGWQTWNLCGRRSFYDLFLQVRGWGMAPSPPIRYCNLIWHGHGICRLFIIFSRKMYSQLFLNVIKLVGWYRRLILHISAHLFNSNFFKLDVGFLGDVRFWKISFSLEQFYYGFLHFPHNVLIFESWKKQSLSQ